MIGMTSETAKSEVPIFRLAAELRKGVDYFFFFGSQLFEGRFKPLGRLKNHLHRPRK
jgi:hypothetical protein